MIDWNHTNLELVRANRGIWRPNRHLQPAWFKSRIIDFDLWLIYAGQGWVRRQDQRFDLRPGTFLCFCPEVEYECGQDESDRLGVAYVHFNFVNKQGRLLRPQEVDGPAFYFDEPPSILLEQLMQRIITLYRGAMADADMAEKFLGMASHLMGSLLRELEFRRALPGDWRSSAPERRYRIVDRFMEILQGDDKSRLTVTEAARVLGFSTDHFIRLVKQETGRTPKTIILEMRINEAKNLLIRTLLNVSEIAYELGYEDVFSFSQQFKAKTGVSPSAFRKSFEMRADATSISNNHKD